MKDCIIITSIVEITNAPFSYSNVRSVYSHEERFNQTIETIESIRKYLPDVDIILVECSPESDYMTHLKHKVDIFLNTYPDDIIRNGYNKGVCEANLMLHIFNKIDLTCYRNIFKMTGRYVLTENFNKDVWIHDGPVGCETYGYGPLSLHTFLYKFTNKEIQLIKSTFNNIVETNNINSIESILYPILKPNMKNIDKIGILVRWSSYDSTPEF